MNETVSMSETEIRILETWRVENLVSLLILESAPPEWPAAFITSGGRKGLNGGVTGTEIASGKVFLAKDFMFDLG